MSQELTENEGRYVKVIYRRQVEERKKVRTTEMANIFGVRPATVTETLQKLAQKNILRHDPYHGVELTGDGLLKAKQLLRKHRLLETLFVNHLNYGVQEACEEACRLDHHASRDLINQICRTYGHPKLCPCNKPIFVDEDCCKA
ncbi:MAG: metal-dependent transcriptional regulator [Thermoproteota archaeon]|nr:metal-dependent transcriptional regulator [Thermoproteota archaeon]